MIFNDFIISVEFIIKKSMYKAILSQPFGRERCCGIIGILDEMSRKVERALRYR